MSPQPDRVAALPRSPSLDCLDKCFAAYNVSSRNASVQEVHNRAQDASVRAQVDTFVRGRDAAAISHGTRLLRRIVETGNQAPLAAASTWFAVLARMERLAPAYALARCIAEFRQRRSPRLDGLLEDVSETMRSRHPQQAETIADTHAQLGALLRSIDPAGLVAGSLASLHDLPQLEALERLVRYPSYETALDCSRRGIAAGQLRGMAQAAMRTAQPSAAAMRVVTLLGCEDAALKMALWENPNQDAFDTRSAFRLLYAPEIGLELDRNMSQKALTDLSVKLAEPAVQAALATQTAALVDTSEEMVVLLCTAMAAKAGRNKPLGRCQPNAEAC